jgi:hypothetical protein
VVVGVAVAARADVVVVATLSALKIVALAVIV